MKQSPFGYSSSTLYCCPPVYCCPLYCCLAIYCCNTCTSTSYISCDICTPSIIHRCVYIRGTYIYIYTYHVHIIYYCYCCSTTAAVCRSLFLSSPPTPHHQTRRGGREGGGVVTMAFILNTASVGMGERSRCLDLTSSLSTYHIYETIRWYTDCCTAVVVVNTSIPVTKRFYYSDGKKTMNDVWVVWWRCEDVVSIFLVTFEWFHEDWFLFFVQLVCRR